MVCCCVGGVVIFGGCFLLGLLILGRDIFWLVGFLCDAVFMVWWFLVGVGFWGCGILGGFYIVRRGGFELLAVFMVWVFSDFWAVGWFLFLAFCRVLPVYTVSNMQVFKFWGWAVYSSARNVCAPYFLFFKGSWMDTAFELL